ncbi:MAG: hypothetical protein AB7T06_39210 [Kofleriaceae bacterium]
MEEEELEELAQQPIPPQAEHVPSVGPPLQHGRDGALDDANHDLAGRSPGAPLTNEQLAHAALLEQMAHGGAYRGDTTGNAAVPEEEGQADLNPMLIQNGYHPNPEVIHGADGLDMVVYRPMPGHNVAPVVAFRGSQEARDWRGDTDVDQVGDAQYESNREMIDRTMSELSSSYPNNRPEVTGHSLGGAIAQRTAADHAEQTGHITTFQAPGIRAEQVEQIEAYNRAHPDAPLTADHFRAEGDVVPYAGEGHAPGSVHITDIAPPEAGVLEAIPGPIGAAANTADRAGRGHTAYIATPYALQTEEGRRALPGISRDPDDYYVRGGLQTEAVDESPYDPGRFAAETARRIVGAHIQLADESGATDAARDIGNQSVDNMDRGMAAGNRNVDRAQAGVDVVNNVANAAVDDVQNRVTNASDDAHSRVNQVQNTVETVNSIGQNTTDAVQREVNNNVRDLVGDRAANVLTANANTAVDGAQELTRRGVSQANAVVDVGQQVARGTEHVVEGVVDAGQESVRSVVHTGQNVVNGGQQVARQGQQAVHDAWNWLTE